MRARVAPILVILGLLMGLTASPVAAASITVNSLADTAPADDGVCTLREAIIAGNTETASGATAGECSAGSGDDVISFSVAGTITLLSALPNIGSPTNELAIVGAGAITVSAGGGAFRVFNATGIASLSGLTITGGAVGAGSGGGVATAGGILTITDSTISGNSALTGGGIANSGILTVTDSTISGNSAVNGGGIINLTGIVDIRNSTISGNSAGNFGGGIETQGASIVDITNSTISGNSAGNIGGGIDSFAGILTVTNSTISGNSAGNAVGGLNAVATADTVVNSIVAGNAGGDVGGAIETSTTNIIGDASVLDAAGLAFNGGPTQTVALAMVAGNPAVDAGTAATCAAAPVSALDQRGMPRPAACDIGAYEVQPPTVAAHADVGAAATSAAGAAVSFTPPAGTDEQGGVAAVACVPASGSTFPIGSTTVTCTATDAVGHTGTGTFQVVVGEFAAPSLPDAAVTRPVAASPWATMGFAALLLGSLAAMAVVNVRGVVRRRR